MVQPFMLPGYPRAVTQSAPWICFHAPWTERARSGMVVLARVQRFLASVAVDPAPDSAELTVYENRPGLVAEVEVALGATGKHEIWASGATGKLARCKWKREHPFDPDPLIDIYRRHEADPIAELAPNKRVVGLTLSYWFEVKRPDAADPLFPGAELRSSVMIFVDKRGANLALRYNSPEMTPALRQAHMEIVAALGPKTPRHALQRIIPATTARGRERREPIE
jgi:hypothetical protein